MNTTVTEPVLMWANVITYTATPMTFCSVASLLASVFLGRWVTLAMTVRQLEARRLEMGINVEKRDPKMHQLVQILESRTERGFKQMRLTRVTVAAFNGSVIFFLIASFINGLQALEFSTAKAVPPLMVIGAAFLVAGLSVAIAEIIRAVPNQRSQKIDEVLEFERSQAPTYNILAAIETTARQSSSGAIHKKHSSVSKDHHHKPTKSKVDLTKTIELLEDKEERKKKH